MVRNVIELLDKHKINYIDNGGDSVYTLCLNPKHNDTHIGSFSIRKADGVCHCFACGFKTNFLGLCNILRESPSGFTSNIEWTTKPKIIKKKKFIYHEPIVMGNLYNPFNNKEVLDFLYSIGVYDNFIKKYDVKYTTYSEMISKDQLGKEDVEYTQMMNRIVVPIYHKGRLINYECRTFAGDIPKVKYVKGCSTQTIFNIENIDKSKMVVVTESMKNMAKIWNVYPNVVSLFHNLLTERQVEMINELDNICLFLDNDMGGFGGETESGTRKGMLQSFTENYHKPFKICYDKRIKRTYDENGKSIIKGYDANDCTLGEIKEHIDNAISYHEYERKNRKIVW